MSKSGWTTEKRNGPVQSTNLMCPCGSRVLFDEIEFDDGGRANRLFCVNCGLQMRSPGDDQGGEWLKKNWQNVVSTPAGGGEAGTRVIDADMRIHWQELDVEHEDWIDRYGTVEDYLSYAETEDGNQIEPFVLPKRKARLMSVSEVVSSGKGAVLWLEERQTVLWNLFPLEIEMISAHSDTGLDYLFFIVFHGHRMFECKEYNQTWRCWTERPSDSQREAAQWND